jgi:hypothetical protein
MRSQTHVDRFLSVSQRVDVGVLGGEAGRHLGTLGDGAVAGAHDVGSARDPADRGRLLSEPVTGSGVSPV